MESEANTEEHERPTIDYDEQRRTNNAIALHAKRKELSEAMALFDKLVEKQWANSHTYAGAINCSIRCGDMKLARSLFDKLKAKRGLKADVVHYTTMMKGYCEIGDMSQASALMEDMKERRVAANVRTMNTFLRGCVQTGDIERAEVLLALMNKDYQVTPDVSSWEYLVILLSQGLKTDKVLPLLGRLKGDAEMASGLSSMYSSLARAAALMGDWKVSRRAIAQGKEMLKADEIAALKQQDGGEGEKGGDGSQKAALGGKRAWKTGDGGEDDTRAQSLALFREHKIAEQKHDLQLVEEYVERKQKQQVELREKKNREKNQKDKESKLKKHKDKKGKKDGKGVKEEPEQEQKEEQKQEQKQKAEEEEEADLLPFFYRVLSFKQDSSSSSDDQLDRGDTAAALSESVLRRYGLDSYISKNCKGGAAPPAESPAKANAQPEAAAAAAASAAAKKKVGGFKKKKQEKVAEASAVPIAQAWRDKVHAHYQSCLDANGHIDFGAVFGAANNNRQSSPHNGPLKLEICSGAGEWAVAQAQHDQKSRYVTLELRHDRVYSTFYRAVCAQTDNLCTIGGDAVAVLQSRVAPGTMANIFINHPEPPQQTNQQGSTSQGKHLLTTDFLNMAAEKLQNDGMLTIVTDNAWYARFLMRQLGGAPHPRALLNVDIAKGSSTLNEFESENGYSIYMGKPDASCGYTKDASSYFDRLWKRGNLVDRYVLALKKKTVEDVGGLRIRQYKKGAAPVDMTDAPKAKKIKFDD